MRILIILAVLAALTVTGAEAKRHKPHEAALLAAPECSVAPDPAARWSWVQVSGSGFVADTFGDANEFTDTMYSVVITNERGDVTLTGTMVQADGTVSLDYFAVWAGANTVTIWKPVDGVDITAVCAFEIT